jgi:hypothetical protein
MGLLPSLRRLSSLSLTPGAARMMMRLAREGTGSSLPSTLKIPSKVLPLSLSQRSLKKLSALATSMLSCPLSTCAVLTT